MKRAVLLIVASILATQIISAPNPQSKLRNSASGTSTQLNGKGNGKINGVLLKDATGTILKNATVALINQATDKVVATSYSDEKGLYNLDRIAAGQYTLSVSYAGYATKTLDSIVIAQGTDEVNMGTIALQSDASLTEAVSAINEELWLNDKLDHFVYINEKGITLTGRSAAELIAKEPCSSIDSEALVNLHNNSTIQVLVNKKPLAIKANSVADALSQIEAEQIKVIEVISRPLANKLSGIMVDVVINITKNPGLE